MLVLATGFALEHRDRAVPDLRPRRPRRSTTAWERGAVAYKGMTVAGFPNWFILMGPNTGPGHTSVLVFTEARSSYALQAIRSMIARSDAALGRGPP